MKLLWPRVDLHGRRGGGQIGTLRLGIRGRPAASSYAGGYQLQGGTIASVSGYL